MQYYCFKREAVTFPTAKTVLTNHLRSQRESPLGEREDGDEVGKSGCKVGHERQMSLKSKRSPHIVGLGSHGRLWGTYGKIRYRLEGVYAIRGWNVNLCFFSERLWLASA